MKDFNYAGNGILAFSHHEKDYIIHSNGPHSLPEDCDLVISLTSQNLLTEIQTPEIETQKIELTPKTAR